MFAKLGLCSVPLPRVLSQQERTRRLALNSSPAWWGPEDLLEDGRALYFKTKKKKKKESQHKILYPLETFFSKTKAK